MLTPETNVMAFHDMLKPEVDEMTYQVLLTPEADETSSHDMIKPEVDEGAYQDLFTSLDLYACFPAFVLVFALLVYA